MTTAADVLAANPTLEIGDVIQVMDGEIDQARRDLRVRDALLVKLAREGDQLKAQVVELGGHPVTDPPKPPRAQRRATAKKSGAAKKAPARKRTKR